MKLSASSLNTLTKCAYKYKLEQVDGLEEPGKKGYNMLLGDIVGDACQAGALILNERKTITDAEISQCLYDAYENRFNLAGIPEDILAPIHSVLCEGESPEAMALLDMMCISINMSIYEFKPPAPLKSGKPSMNRKKPPFCMKVVNSLAALIWFFDPSQAHYNLIRDAAYVENEKQFAYRLQERELVVNGHVFVEVDEVTGRFDIFLMMPNGTTHVLELKYVNTAYTQALADRMNQFITYSMALNHNTTVHVVDLTERNVFKTEITPEISALVEQRYKWAIKMLEQQIFMPACGTDPYNTQKMLCGFKCGGCAYGDNSVVVEEEEAYA